MASTIASFVFQNNIHSDFPYTKTSNLSKGATKYTILDLKIVNLEKSDFESANFLWNFSPLYVYSGNIFAFFSNNNEHPYFNEN